MNQPNNSENQLDNSLTFIFTNSKGNVIFADQNFIRSIGDISADILSGKQLHTILRMDAQNNNQLIEVINQNSMVEPMTVSYSIANGEVVMATGKILSAIDENGNFLGMDLVLKKPGKPEGMADAAMNFMTHSDVIKAYVEMEMNSRNPVQPRTFTQSYLVVQFNILQIMLARIVGPASRQAFESIVNSTASSMGLPISMEKGNLIFSKMDIGVQGYRSLLQTISNYAVIVVGKSIVKREMLLVDKFVGRGTLELISQMNLRIFSAE